MKSMAKLLLDLLRIKRYEDWLLRHHWTARGKHHHSGPWSDSWPCLWEPLSANTLAAITLSPNMFPRCCVYPLCSLIDCHGNDARFIRHLQFLI